MPADRGQDTRDQKKGRRGIRPLAATVPGLAAKALGKRGFAEAGLITEWAAIVGAELAGACWPDRISFPAGRRSGGTLRIRVAGGLALELQHMEPQLLERINGYFGYRAVERITLFHAPPGEVPGRRPARPSAAAKRDPTQAESAGLEASLDGVEDPEIRAALARLGRAMISDSPKRGDGGGDG